MAKMVVDLKKVVGMLIKKIKLHNIRSYLSEEVNFPAGSVLLSGDIGSGKSSILLAIEFALFGADVERVSGNALLRKGANEGHVELVFELDGKEISIRRGLKKSRNAIAQTAGYIAVNGIRKEAMPVEIKAEVINMLGYPEELVTKKKNLIYRYTVYCPQEEMKAILVDEQESRLDTLRKIFGVDKYKRIRENCLIVVRELRKRQEVMEAEIKGLEELKKEAEEKNVKLKELDGEINEINVLLKKITEEIEIKRKKMKVIEEEYDLFLENRKKLALIEAQEGFKKQTIENNEIKIKKLKAIVEEVKVEIDIGLLQAEIDKREKQLQMVTTQKTILEQKYSNLIERIKELEKEIAVDYAAEIDKKKMQMYEIEAKLGRKEDIAKNREAIEEILQKLKSVLGEYEVKKKQSDELKTSILHLAECPTCKQRVTKEHKEKVHDEEMKKIEFYQQNIVKYKETIKEREAELLLVKKEMDESVKVEMQLAVLQAESANLEKQQAGLVGKKSLAVELIRQREQMRLELDKYLEVDVESERNEVKQLRGTLEKGKEK